MGIGVRRHKHRLVCGRSGRATSVRSGRTGQSNCFVSDFGNGEKVAGGVAAGRSVGSRRPVEHYLRRGQDVNATDARGRTLLLIAAAKGHAQLCRLLIDAGADASLRDSEGIDALSAATRNGHGEARPCYGPLLRQQHQPSAQSTSAAVTADEEDVDLANWEELPESQPPADNATLRPDARRLQNRLSRHAAIDTDDDWSDVDIDLPDARSDTRSIGRPGSTRFAISCLSGCPRAS